jgi:hypothetical protein
MNFSLLTLRIWAFTQKFCIKLSSLRITRVAAVTKKDFEPLSYTFTQGR